MYNIHEQTAVLDTRLLQSVHHTLHLMNEDMAFVGLPVARAGSVRLVSLTFVWAAGAQAQHLGSRASLSFCTMCMDLHLLHRRLVSVEQ